MSVLEGLAAYKARKAAEDARRDAAQKPRIARFALKKDGDSAVIRFAQEIDFDAANYNEDRGIGFVNIEHTSGADPKNGWKNRANCSTDSQGACLPCEKVADYSVEWNERKGWKQKEKFYINVIGGEPREEVETVNGNEKKRYFTTDIDRKTGDGTVYLLEQGTYNGIWDALAAYALDEDSGATITNVFFKITRKGSGFNDTSYVLTPLKDIPADAKSLDDFELVNIREDVLVEVPYAQQDAFYHKGLYSEDAPREAGAPAAAAVSATSTDESW